MPITKEKREKIESVKEVLALSNTLPVRKIAHYHYRVNNTIDIFPYTNRYYDLVTGERGSYSGQNLNTFLLKHLDLERKEMVEKVLESVKSRINAYILDVLMEVNNDNEYNLAITMHELMDFLSKNK